MDSNDLSPLAGGTLPDPKGRSYLLDTNVLLHDAACLDAFAAHLPRGMDRGVADNRILATALALQSKGSEVIFVSKDINARVRAPRWS